MATLTTTNGRPGTEIADARGEVHAYALRRLGPAVWEVVREDTGAAYEVAFRGGRWRCTCPAYQYRGRWRRDDCKHTLAVAEISTVLAALAGQSGVSP